MAPIIFLIILLLVFGFICRAIAIKRNLNEVFWFAMGAAFGPLALLFVLFTKIRRG